MFFLKWLKCGSSMFEALVDNGLLFPGQRNPCDALRLLPTREIIVCHACHFSITGKF